MSIDKNGIILSDAARKKFDKLRKDNEKYNGLSDAELAYRMHRDFYSHVKIDDFLKSIKHPIAYYHDTPLQNSQGIAVWRNSKSELASKQKWSNSIIGGIVVIATVLALLIIDNDFSNKSDDTNLSPQREDPVGDESQSPPTTSRGEGESTGTDEFTTTEPSQREPPGAPSPMADPPVEPADPLAVDPAPIDERPSVADALPTCPEDRESTWTECFGELSYPDGRVYRGEWRDDQLNGEGEMLWPDGRLYRGTFKDDMRHGQGVMRYPNGTSQSGLWENDKYVSN